MSASLTVHEQSPAKERAVLLTLAAIQFTHILDFMIIMPLGSHLMRVFDISPAQFSHLVAAYGLAASITGFSAGFVLDRFDRKHALLALYAGFCVATFSCALATSYHALLVSRFAAGAFGGVASSVVVAMVGDVIPAARRGRAMGTVTVAFPIASVLGVPVGLALAGAYSWHAPFFMLGGIGFVVLAIASRLLPPLRPQHPPAHPWQQMKAILINPVHQRALAMTAALIFAGGVVIPFIAPSLVANVGLAEGRLPLVYFAGGICTFATTPLIGRLSDRFDKLHVLGWVTVGASVVVLALTNLPRVPIAVAIVVMALFMIAMSGRFAPAMAMVTNAVDSKYRGGFMSVNSAVQQASSGVANLVSGWLIVTSADGRLVGYPKVGLLSLAMFWLTFYLAARLRAAAPHASRPRRGTLVQVAVTD